MAAIRKRGKKWEYTIRYKDKDGKSRRKSDCSFTKKSDAIQAASEMELKLRKGKFIDSDITFLDYYDQWITNFKAGKHSKVTEARYKMIHNQLKEHFGTNQKLANMTRTDWQGFINEYGSTRARETVSKLNGYVRDMARSAVIDRIIDFNFTEGITLAGGKGKSEELKYLELEDYKKLKEYTFQNSSMDKIFNYIIAVGIMTGARYSEIMGLTWKDIDFKSKKIDINKSWDYTYTKNFKETKTPSSIREIDIDSDLTNLLKKLKKEQTDYFNSINYSSINSLVFLNKRLEIMTDPAINKDLHRIEKGLKITPEITFHGLRHTHVSYLISKGIDINYISQRLGHSNVGVTMKVYSHLLKEHEEKEAKKTIIALEAL